MAYSAKFYMRRAYGAIAQWLQQPFSKMICTAVLMMGGLVCAIGYMALTHQHLQAVQAEATEFRSLRSSLSQTDILILNGLANTASPFHSSGFWDSLNQVRHAVKGRDIASLTIADTPEGARKVLDLIETNWTKAAEHLATVDPAWRSKAAGAYFDENTPVLVSGLLAAVDQKSSELDATGQTLSAKIEVTGLLALLMQVGVTALFIQNFQSGARRSRRESAARLAAITEAETSREKVTRLFQMAEMLQSAINYDDANDVLRSSAAELIFGFSGALYVFNNSRDRLVLSTTWEREGYDPLPETLGIDQCWALKRGKPNINRPHSRKLCCKHHSSSDYALEIPMLARGEVLGLLQIYAEGDEAEQRLEGIRGLGAAIADAMSLALSNIALREKLRGQALRDPLTGLYNRRYMEDALDRFVGLAEREKRELSVVMIDLDHFKRLNDQYGHAKGDSVLRDSAAILKHALRDTDVACRYGGEELMLLLPDCPIEMAIEKADEIRRGIENLTEPNGAPVSASLGVASYDQHTKSVKEIVASADAALYQAKQKGRNRVVRAQPRSVQNADARRNEASVGAANDTRPTMTLEPTSAELDAAE